jgi:Major Facilitator Superfamily
MRVRQSSSSLDEDGDDGGMVSSSPRLFEPAAVQRRQGGADFEALEAADEHDAVYSLVTVNENNNNDNNSKKRSITRHQNFQRKWAVTLFSIITILLFADQNLMAPNLTAIAEDFGFNEQERDQKLGGDIALGFWLLGAPAAVVIGCMADTYNRAILFSITAAIGEGACLATYFAQTYTQLYVCRALTGFALGGAVPLIYSILGDLYPANERHAVSAIVSMGSGLGQTIGQGVAGFLGPTFGWRLPFAIIGLPSLVCALVVFLTVEDPERGAMEEATRNFKRHQDSTPDEQDNDDTSSPGASSVEMKPLGPARSFGAVQAGDSSERSAVETAATTCTSDSISRRPRNRDSSLSDEIVIIRDNNNSHDMQAYWATFVSLLSDPTAVLTFIQGAPGCVPWGIINTYLNDFLAQDRGMKVEVGTTVCAIQWPAIIAHRTH